MAPGLRKAAVRAAGAGVLVIALWAGVASRPAVAYEPVSVPVQPVQVTPATFYVQGRAGMVSLANQGFNSNAGFVVTREGVVVIDALGTVPLGAELLRAIRARTPLPVKRVVVTHYHADHFYGLAPFRQAGAEIWAHRAAQPYLDSEEPQRRLDERRRSLSPWVTDATQVLRPDVWLDGDTSFRLGGLTFDVIHMGPAHSPEDLVVVVREEGVIYAGDLIFSGRVPFVGEADSRRWLATIDRLLTLKPKLLVTGHGPVSTRPAQDLQLTRDYLIFLRQAMGKAVEDFVPFEEAYASTDWSRFASLPAFEPANRTNAYGQYLQMERELLQRR